MSKAGIPSDNQCMCSAPIVLCTLNAKYIHASLGLRYLQANMKRYGGVDLHTRTMVREYTIARKPQEVVDGLLTLNPAIIGCGVYIWNVVQITEIVRLLKHQRPAVQVVLGGPEVSHECESQEIVALADHVILGWGDVSFPKLCRALVHGPQPLTKIIPGEQPDLAEIELPYDCYTDADLAHRQLYVEASRGCPFKCEFCLSSLDKTAWAFDSDAFMVALQSLYQRGARNFKFVDRTFNLKVETSARILHFFLDRLQHTQDSLFVHFEIIPDHLPERLKELIQRFPAGVLQFEVGIQSLNVDVQRRVSRRQDNVKTEANLHWLVQHTQAHLHADLIFGLPGETLESFAAGFDRLYAMDPNEIQLGILKRLRGTPIIRHTDPYGMVYEVAPPYTVLQTASVDANTMQRFSRMARYWNLIVNSGRFQNSTKLLLQGVSAFSAFWEFSIWLWQRTRETRGLTPEQLVDFLCDYLHTQRGLPLAMAQQALVTDYMASGVRARPQSIRQMLPAQKPPRKHSKRSSLAARQERHNA